jgi:hypothetical protein
MTGVRTRDLVAQNHSESIQDCSLKKYACFRMLQQDYSTLRYECTWFGVGYT